MPTKQELLTQLRAKKKARLLTELREKKRVRELKTPPSTEPPPQPDTTVVSQNAPVDTSPQPKLRGVKPGPYTPPVTPKYITDTRDAIVSGVSSIANDITTKTKALVDTINDALAGEPVSHPGGVLGVSGADVVKFQKSIPVSPPVKPIEIEAKRTPIVEGTKKLVEYLQIKDSPTPLSPFAVGKQQIRAREVLDGFGGDKNALHKRIRMIAKSEGKSNKWVTDTFYSIVNTASGVKPGSKVSNSESITITQKIPRKMTADRSKKPEPQKTKDVRLNIDPTSFAEGAMQFVTGALGGDLKSDPANKRAASIGKTLGQVTQIASTIGASASLGKTIALSSKSKMMKTIGGALANPNTNPVPDAVLAATSEDGDKFDNFLAGYAINLVAGRLLEKEGLSVIVDMPGKERKVLKGHMEDLVKEYKKSDRLQKLNVIPDADLAQAETMINTIDQIDIVDMARKKRFDEIKSKIPTVRKEAPKTPDKKSIQPETQTVSLDDLSKKTSATTEDVTQTNGKRGIFQREKKITLDPAFDRARAAVKALGRPTLRSIRNAFIKQVVDISGNLKRELKATGESGQLVIDRMEQALGASGKAKMRYEQAMDDIYGSTIKSTNRKNLVSDIISARRTLLIDAEKPGIKHGAGMDPVRLKARLAYLEQNEPEAFKQANDAADRYFNQMSGLLDDRFKAGLIDKNVYDDLKGKIYSPREFLSHMNDSHQGLSSTLGESESGLKRILEGSDAEIVNDLEYLMAKSITSAERQIASNNAGKQMYDLLKTGEAGDLLVDLKPIYGKKKQIVRYAKPPKGYDAVSVMIDGKKVQYGIRSDMASEFILKDPLLAPEVSKWLRIASGNNILKFNATQASTDFPLANVFRDVGTIMFANREYSNFIPLASAQLGHDMATVFKDAVTRKGRVIDMMNQGGSMDFLMATADTWGVPGRKKLAGPVRGVVDGLRWLGETSELMTRLALRERALKNYIKQGVPLADAEIKATLAARRYMDFGQGGAAVKALDNVMPYFNAAIQGHRAWIRGAKTDPAGFTAKILQVGGASAALTTYNIVNNEEAYDAIPNRIKTSNWVITTPHYRVDEDGVKEYMYYTIPKPPGISAGFSVFEATAEAAQGRDVPYQQVLMGLDDFMALGSVPPTLAATLALVGNIDSYTWEQIYKGGRDIDKEAEITKSTPEWAIRAGEITGQSPERIRTAKSKFFTYRNGWLDASAATIDFAYSQMTNKEINEVSEKLATPEGAPGLRRFVRFTSSEVAREKVGDSMREYNTRRKRQNMEMDKIFKNDGNDAVRTFIDEQPEEDRSALRQRANNLRKHADIPKHFININYIASSSPAIKAKAMFDEWDKADPAGKEKIDEYTHRIIGMDSRNFRKMYQFYKDEAASK